MRWIRSRACKVRGTLPARRRSLRRRRPWPTAVAGGTAALSASRAFAARRKRVEWRGLVGRRGFGRGAVEMEMGCPIVMWAVFLPLTGQSGESI